MGNKKIEALKFAFRQGARYGVDAQVVGAELVARVTLEGVAT